ASDGQAQLIWYRDDQGGQDRCVRMRIVRPRNIHASHHRRRTALSPGHGVREQFGRRIGSETVVMNVDSVYCGLRVAEVLVRISCWLCLAKLKADSANRVSLSALKRFQRKDRRES